MRGRTLAEVMCALLMVGLCVAPSGLATTAPARKASTGYDFSGHFREPLGWPLAGEFGPGKDGGKAAISVETDDVHTSPTAIRLDTAGCKQSVLVLNYVLPETLIEPFKGKPLVFSGYVKRVAGKSPLHIYQRNFSRTEFLLASRSASAGQELGKWERLELRFVIPPSKDVVRVDFHSAVEATSEPTVLLVDDCKVEIAEPAGTPGPNGVAGIEPAKEPLVLVQDGKPVATIVIATSATRTVRFAVSELNRHLKLSTGTELPVAQDGAVIAGPTVQVGSTALAERFGLAPRFHAPDHWVVWRVGSALVLSGGDAASADVDPAEAHHLPFGTLYATYEFLERVLGVRWYWPGDLGRVVPKCPTVSLARVQWSGAPAYDTRFCFFEFHDDPAITRQESNLWWRRMRRGGPGGSPIANHSYNDWPAKYGKTHPEYFALQRDGKRLTSGGYLDGAYMGGHVCHSNPDVLALTIQEKRRTFDENPWLRYSPVMPGDGNFGCLCEKCVAAQRPDMGESGRNSDLIWGFVNKVAAATRQTHPDRFITCCSYADYVSVPRDVAFEPNVAVTLCTGLALPSMMSSPEYRASYLDRIGAWSRKSANLYVWDYWNVPRWNKGQYGAPAVYPHAVKESFLLEQGRVRGRTIELTQFDSEGRDVTKTNGRGHWADWMYDSLNVYVAFRLMWNMDQDVDAMLDEFYREFYGPAGPWVRRFYGEMEMAYLRPRRDAGWDWSAIWLETYPPDFVAKSMGYLREAERVSRGQEPYHARAVKTLEGFAPVERVSRWYTGGAKASAK